MIVLWLIHKSFERSHIQIENVCILNYYKFVEIRWIFLNNKSSSRCKNIKLYMCVLFKLLLGKMTLNSLPCLWNFNDLLFAFHLQNSCTPLSSMEVVTRDYLAGRCHIDSKLFNDSLQWCYGRLSLEVRQINWIREGKK